MNKINIEEQKDRWESGQLFINIEENEFYILAITGEDKQFGYALFSLISLRTGIMFSDGLPIDEIDFTEFQPFYGKITINNL